MGMLFPSQLIPVTDVMDDVNQLWVGTEHEYYNSGVMLMKLVKIRELVKPVNICVYVREYSAVMLLPNQDVIMP
jgi:lipopolysaccharide biosynthesis glycosyltransferase